MTPFPVGRKPDGSQLGQIRSKADPSTCSLFDKQNAKLLISKVVRKQVPVNLYHGFCSLIESNIF